MKNSYITDTMALILRLERRKLNTKIKRIFENVENKKVQLIIPTMVLAEIGYLAEKKRIDTTLDEVKNYISIFNNISVQPITEEIIYTTFEIDDIPELHDRIIAGTAKHLGLTLITNDPAITDSRHLSVKW